MKRTTDTFGATHLAFVRAIMVSALVGFSTLTSSLHASPSNSAEQDALTVYHRHSEDDKDRRRNYEIAVIELALEKTLNQYGDYNMHPTPGSMTQSRLINYASQNTFENLLFTIGYDEQLIQEFDLAYVPFPIFLGVVGFRVCFVSEKAKNVFTNAHSISDLRALMHGHGKGWLDGQISVFSKNLPVQPTFSVAMH
jgi:hypothetical protein